MAERRNTADSAAGESVNLILKRKEGGKKENPKLIFDINSYVQLSELWFKPASYERPTSIN